jgi:hypothetical protein
MQQDAKGKLLNQQPAYDKILRSEVSLQLGESMTIGRATKRALGPGGTVADTYDGNPCLNTMLFAKLKDMKESHPVKTAEFAKARSVADEAAFTWWTPCTLHERDVMLSKINARIRKTTHKHGVETLTSVDNANEIDRRNNNTFWKDALAKEMTEVGVAFEALKESIKAPIGLSKM